LEAGGASHIVRGSGGQHHRAQVVAETVRTTR
jgi:hypothetical protein